MILSSIDQILLKLSLEVAGKVNHDLLGSMHVVNFCSEEMATESMAKQPERLNEYGLKLCHSTRQMSETIRLSRQIVNTLKGMLGQGDKRVLLLGDALNFSYALSQLFHRHLPPLALEVKAGKRMRSTELAIEQAFIFTFVFDWLTSQHPADGKTLSVVFEEAPDSDMLLFSLPQGIVTIDSITTDFVQSHHPLHKYLEYLGKQDFIERITKERDIIGMLRSGNGRDIYYFHVELFQREFTALLT